MPKLTESRDAKAPVSADTGAFAMKFDFVETRNLFNIDENQPR